MIWLLLSLPIAKSIVFELVSSRPQRSLCRWIAQISTFRSAVRSSQHASTKERPKDWDPVLGEGRCTQCGNHKENAESSWSKLCQWVNHQKMGELVQNRTGFSGQSAQKWSSKEEDTCKTGSNPTSCAKGRTFFNSANCHRGETVLWHCAKSTPQGPEHVKIERAVDSPFAVWPTKSAQNGTCTSCSSTSPVQNCSCGHCDCWRRVLDVCVGSGIKASFKTVDRKGGGTPNQGAHRAEHTEDNVGGICG